MTTRRHFLQRSAATAIALAAARAARTSDLEAGDARRLLTHAGVTQTRSPRIRSLSLRDETILRLGGEGDNWYMTWDQEDRQLIALCDGMGFSEQPEQLYNTRLLAVRGTPQTAAFEDVSGYPNKPHRDGANARFYGFGTLAVGGSLYQYLSTFADSTLPKGEAPPTPFNGVKLIYSPDNGRRWFNQDGTTPVVWNRMDERSRANMVFFQESQDSFGMLSILQMGRDYAANRDGYLYVYAPNGSIEGTMNQLVMFRVKKNGIRDRARYEYFAGLRADGRANWSRDILQRAVVHTFPRGWVNKTAHPMAWSPSVTYNVPLGLYMMANWGMGYGPDPAVPNGHWFAKPSYLGFWTATQPWGPWTQIHEETAWTPGNDAQARAYSPVIAPKWISEDGRSFWLVWTDFQHTEQFWPLIDKAGDAIGHEEFMRFSIAARAQRPYYAFNVQRVDLVV